MVGLTGRGNQTSTLTLRGARSIGEFQLQTETSTQTAFRRGRKLPRCPFRGKDEIIAGTPRFGKCFNHSALGTARTILHWPRKLGATALALPSGTMDE